MDGQHDTCKRIRTVLPGADCALCGCQTCDEAAGAMVEHGLCAPACVRLPLGQLKELTGLLALHCASPTRCCSGAASDCRAFQRLYAVFRGTILQVGRWHRLPEDENEDLVQQTMLELWKCCTEKRIDNVRALLVCIAHRKAKSRITHRARVRRLERDYVSEHCAAMTSECDTVNEERRYELLRCVASLPPRMQEAATLVWLEHTPVRDAAVRMVLREKTVYSLLDRAKAKIRCGLGGKRG